MCAVPLADDMKPFRYRHQGEKSSLEDSNDTLSLVLSGEYYTAFSLIDCFIIWTTLTIYIVLEGCYIGQAAIAYYALPFIFLQIIPIYWFILNVIMAATTKSYGPAIFNAFVFVLMSFCFAMSMLHVCAIPGVTAACAAHVPHTVTVTNVLVCAPYMFLILMASVGLVTSSYTPSFLISRDCVSKA